MGLDFNLISQFAKLVKNEKETNKESIVYGRAISDKQSGITYVQIDGSDVWTPVQTTTTIKSEDKENGERVTVMIKDHSAIIIGSTSSPSAKAEDVNELEGKIISEFDIIFAHKITTEEFGAMNAVIENLKSKNAELGNLEAIAAQIETLEAKIASFDKVTVDDMAVFRAEIEKLRVTFAEITDLEVEDLNAVNAEIDYLETYTGTFTYLSSEFFKAANADIKKLNVGKLNADFANIDYANIDEAAFKEFYAESGLIENVTAENGTVTGYLVGVTIKGDLIEANTLVADKLVIKGTDGLYYKINYESGTFTEGEEVPTDSLHGSVITAKSITAEKVSVSDLVAFGATIGGFHITDNSIYSGVKDGVDNSTRGAYLDSDGQVSFGDDTNFIRYYYDPDEERWKLEIVAESILFGVNSKSSTDGLNDLMRCIKMGTYTNPDDPTDTDTCIEISEGESDFKQVITNSKTMYLDGGEVGTSIDRNGLETKNASVNGNFRQGNYVWASHGLRGNYGLMWKEATK